MAEKILRTKIALLYKTADQWDAIKDTYVPLKGEVCFCDVPESSEENHAILFKVGNGEDTFEDLPWASALAADVFAWAKKASLDFADLDQNFLDALMEYIGGEEKDTIFRLVEDDNNVVKLQKSEDNGESWVDVSGSAEIDLGAIEDAIAANTAAISAEEARAIAEEAKKVDKEVRSGNNVSLIFNEADGGGAQITTATNKGFAGVHDGSNPDETYATMYVKNANGTQTLVRIDLDADGKAYYLKNGASASDDAEIATKGDIASLVGVLHYIGSTNKHVDSEGHPTETDQQAIARLLQEKGHTAEAGDVVIIDDAEYIYDGEEWKEIGNEGNYATKAALQSEIERAQAAEEVLDEKIDNLATVAHTGNVNDLVQTAGDILVLDCN